MRTIYTNACCALTGEPLHLLVENSRIVERADRPMSFDASARVDLKGHAIFPAFIDAHCHILPIGLFLKQLDLSSCQTHEDVKDALRTRNSEMEAGKWLLATQYDQNSMNSGDYLTLADLDEVCPDRPVLVRHVSGHASILNSQALQVAGVHAGTPDPAGGQFGRDSAGFLNGLCREAAHDQVSKAVPTPSHDEMVEAILAAADSMRSLGICSATDMLTGRYGLQAELSAYEVASRHASIRLRLMPLWSQVFGEKGIGLDAYREWKGQMSGDRCRILGIKLFADGAIGSGTAAIYGRYQKASGLAVDHIDEDGQLIYPPEELRRRVQLASDAGERVAVHAIGDRAVDAVMDAFSATDSPERHRCEHAMLLSNSQIERLSKLGCHVTFQPEFLSAFGVTYQSQLGPDRARSLKRVRSVLDAGIPISLNSDRPIVSGDPWAGIRAAVTRPEGFDPSEGISLREALHAYTLGGAIANADEADLGTLEAGQLAEFNIWDQKFDLGSSPRLVESVTSA